VHLFVDKRARILLLLRISFREQVISVSARTEITAMPILPSVAGPKRCPASSSLALHRNRASECPKARKKTRSVKRPAKRDFEQEIAAQLKLQYREKDEEIASCRRDVDELSRRVGEHGRATDRLMEGIQEAKEDNKKFWQLHRENKHGFQEVAQGLDEFTKAVDRSRQQNQAHAQQNEAWGRQLSANGKQLDENAQTMEEGMQVVEEYKKQVDRCGQVSDEYKQEVKDLLRRTNIYDDEFRAIRRDVRRLGDELRRAHH
ncbi:hypothetical protein EVG20_g11453, partial [Dentipellis fragilis]